MTALHTQIPRKHAELRDLDSAALRQVIRAGAYAGHTAGLGMGRLQANLAILPERLALDFFRFCQRNPRSCPLVGVNDTGDPHIPTLGADLDLRTDLPGYNIYRAGRLSGTVADIADLWAGDHVAFALGCSFTFEAALREAGMPLRHVELDRTVPMFESDLRTIPAGPFGGRMVVSMRPMPEADVARVTEICADFPQAHGAPVHIGDPAAIGILDLQRPDFGDPVPVHPGEVPVFWACGVTPQVVIRRAAPDLFIAHRPGAMLVTDVNERANPPILTPSTEAHHA